MQAEHIDWSEPFNELQPEQNPTLQAEDFNKALNKFCSFHIDDLTAYHKGHKMDERQNLKIRLLPDLMDWIPREFRGGWMLKPNFSF